MKRNTYLSERTLGKGTRFKSESQEKVRNNRPKGNKPEETPEEKYGAPMLEDIVKEEEDITYLPPYTKVFISQINRDHCGSIWCKKNLEKPWNKKAMIMEVLESYYDPRVPSKDALVNLISSYLEVLDTWISELGRPAKHESQSENKTVGTLKIKNEAEKTDHVNETNTPGIRKAKPEAYKPYQESAERNPKDNKMQKPWNKDRKRRNLRYEDYSEEIQAENDEHKTPNCPNEIGFETNEHEAFSDYQATVNMNHLHKAYHLEYHDQNRIRVEKDGDRGLHYACEKWKRKVNEFLRKDSEGKRQNEENYYLNDLGRPNIIDIQAEIERTEEVLDVGANSGIKNLEHCRQRGIEVEKDEHEVSKDYERPTERKALNIAMKMDLNLKRTNIRHPSIIKNL
ncbi:hypothetical protein C2G38_2199832 [Gigaspora rosea]|uniref:Uncharacterized protein n=1 Tax=Gigaspora rosea TaxID=44941 RepID=A0A397UUA0_9GLOM|nr:hypothetical protein C2G38_2199832 [Gigaspora rosea]